MLTLMRIGYFGGSFDPPHVGHLAIARAAADVFALDSVLFAPAAHQPLKPQGSAASYQQRLAMVSLMCATQPADPRFEASTLDAPLPNDGPNYTIDTLRRLRSTLLPTDSIYSIVGLDAFLDLPSWRDPQILLTLADWIVVTRPGFNPDQFDKLHLSPAERSHVHLLKDIAEPASATAIRSRLALSEDCSTLLNPQVIDYIHTHHLYTA